MNSNMTPVDWAKRPVTEKYADFSGRAPRAEYWWFVLAEVVVLIIAKILDGIIGSDIGGSGSGIFYILVCLALLVPGIAVSIRRLHDTDKTGWWLLIAFVPIIGAIVLIVFMVQEGTAGSNQYGPNPYGEGGGRIPAE